MLPRPKKACQVMSNIKLICFLDIKRVVHAEFVPPGQTANQAFYLEVLKGLHNSERQKRTGLWGTKGWFFHHVNAPAHGAISVSHFLSKNGMIPYYHASFSPNLALCDFKNGEMKGHSFYKVDDEKKKQEWGLQTYGV